MLHDSATGGADVAKLTAARALVSATKAPECTPSCAALSLLRFCHVHQAGLVRACLVDVLDCVKQLART